MQRNPVYVPFIAGAAITARKAVKFSGDRTVATNTAETIFSVGLLSQLSAELGEHVDVIMGGIAEGIAGGNITRGDALTSDANGDLVAVTNAMKAAGDVYVVGYAMESAVDEDIFGVFVQPHLLSKAAAYA